MSSTLTTSSKPRAVDAQACSSSAISNSSLTARSSERKAVSSASRSAVTLSVSAASMPASWPRTTRTGPVAARSSAAALRTSRHGSPSSCSASARLCRLADPQLALAVQPELAVLPVGARQQIRRRLVPAVSQRFEDQDRVLRLVAGEVDILGARPERVVGVVGPPAQIARGDDDPLAGEARGERGTACRGVGGLRNGGQAVQLGVRPARLHGGGQLVGHRRVEPVLALLDRLVLSGALRFLRRPVLRRALLVPVRALLLVGLRHVLPPHDELVRPS